MHKTKYPRFEPPLIKNKVARNILISLAIGVAVPVFLSSPYGAYFLVRGAVKSYFRKQDFNREIKRLERNGYVALTKTPKGWLVRLLAKGQRRASTAKMQELKLPKHQKWDGKWRLFVFDIPENRKPRRDLLRAKLKDMGLYNFQRSTFVYPYDCLEELSVVANYYEVDKYVSSARIDYIDIDRELRTYFRSSKVF